MPSKLAAISAGMVSIAKTVRRFITSVSWNYTVQSRGTVGGRNLLTCFTPGFHLSPSSSLRVCTNTCLCTRTPNQRRGQKSERTEKGTDMFQERAPFVRSFWHWDIIAMRTQGEVRKSRLVKGLYNGASSQTETSRRTFLLSLLQPDQRALGNLFPGASGRRTWR
jgi:hypothetical protein